MKVAAPLVSVVMPVYNGEKYLFDAINSILNQTIRDVELIVVDDCSKDATGNILEEIRDPRLKVVRNAVNRGGTASMNCGLACGNGEYVARMDADDIALPDRFEKQITFLESSGVGMTHSNVEFIDENGRKFGQSACDLDPLSMNWHMLFDSYAFHPTFFWRRELVASEVGFYDETFEVAQDYDFAWKALRRVGFAGMGERLLRYRVHGSNVTSTKRSRQQQLVAQASLAHISEALGLDIPQVSREFEDVRELVIFRNPSEWNPQRVTAVLPRYLLLWHKFLSAHNLERDWASRPTGLRNAALKDMLNVTGVYTTARDLKGFRKSLELLQQSGVVPSNVLVKAKMRHHWEARFRTSRKNKPAW